MLFLFVLITFEPILDRFLTSWKNPEIQDGGPRWPPFRYDQALIISLDVMTSRCGRERRHLRRSIYPPSLVIVAFIFSELQRGTESATLPAPPVVEDRKKPGLNRIKMVNSVNINKLYDWL